MHSSIIIASILAVAATAAPTPECTPHCCQSLQLRDSSPMSQLLASLQIARRDITGLIGIGCISDTCPSRIVGVESCCSGPTDGRTVTWGCRSVTP